MEITNTQIIRTLGKLRELGIDDKSIINITYSKLSGKKLSGTEKLIILELAEAFKNKTIINFLTNKGSDKDVISKEITTNKNNPNKR